MSLKPKIDRREFIKQISGAGVAGLTLGTTHSLLSQSVIADPSIRIAAMEIFTINVTARTNWIVIRLKTNNGVTGLGEASLGRRRDLPELRTFYAMVDGESPFAIQQYRLRGWQLASRGDRNMATAFSAIEQALWDISGKAIGIPVYQLLGGIIHTQLPVYANINRATTVRTAAVFADKAQLAINDGFTAIKAAPFDGFPALSASSSDLQRARDAGIDSVMAMRAAIGDDMQLKIDAHSFFDVDLAISIAEELEPANLSWYEEPIAPADVAGTAIIHNAINQPLAGGEFLFGMEGFGPLCDAQAVDVIMPDVKHCGGLLEAQRIAVLAEHNGISVSPHNPSGPVATAASVSLAAVLPNFEILEYQWGEANWRSELIYPPEEIINGSMAVNHRPGFGIELNDRLASEHS